MFENFHGHELVAAALDQMIAGDRIPQTILLAGPEGAGKATLARRFAARLLGAAEKIEKDDLSLEENRKLIADREKWPSEKRTDDPLLFATHPDFVTFCPEGPLRQISISQMRLVKERAQLRPLKGQWRVFLIDQFDRANPQAADSLLKTLEEPPPHLILFLTAENPYDLPPTIRSRSVIFCLSPLPAAQMRAFLTQRGLSDVERRIALSGGCPGLAATLDLPTYEKRRNLALAMLESAANVGSFADWVRKSESFVASKSEKFDFYFKPIYALVEDVLVLHGGGTAVRNTDIRPAIEKLASKVTFEWLRQAVDQVDDLISLQRRNVQKGPSADHFVVSLRVV